MGHNIVGSIVNNEICKEEELLQYKLLELMRELEHDSNQTKNEKLKVWPGQIAVLCDNGYRRDQVSCILEANGYPVGSIKEQCLEQQKLIAVDLAKNSPSYEWAVVIFIEDNDFVGYFTPLSRAISKLYIFDVKNNLRSNIGWDHLLPDSHAGPSVELEYNETNFNEPMDDMPPNFQERIPVIVNEPSASLVFPEDSEH